MSDFLQEMGRLSAARAAVLHRRIGMDVLTASIEKVIPPKSFDRHPSGFDVMTEIKLSSPAVGRIVASDFDTATLTSLSSTYVTSGAAAVSVLTEESRFDGSMRHLRLVAPSVGVPVMRKDFLVDPIQIVEARAAGASGVLLIARMLSAPQLELMTDFALSLKMFAVVEVFDRQDLEAASVVFDRDVLVGVNSRDLATLRVDFAKFEALAGLLPNHLPSVAESGISSPDQIADIASMGYELALVGSALVGSPDPGELLSRMIGSGRAVNVGL